MGQPVSVVSISNKSQDHSLPDEESGCEEEEEVSPGGVEQRDEDVLDEVVRLPVRARHSVQRAVLRHCIILKYL